MNNDGQLGRLRQFHLPDEDCLLHVPRRMIVKVVEADFSPRNHARIPRQLRHSRVVFFGDQSRFVRMNTHRLAQTFTLDSIRASANRIATVDRVGTIAIPNRQHRDDASRFSRERNASSRSSANVDLRDGNGSRCT